MSIDKLKIFIVSQNYPSSHSLERFYERAYLSLGAGVSVGSIFDGMATGREKGRIRSHVRHRINKCTKRGLSPDIAGEKLVDQVKKYKPQLTIVFKCERLKGEAVRELRNLSSLGCVNIYTDSPFVIPGPGAGKFGDVLREYSTVFTFSKSLISAFYQLGAKDAQWLPFGYDPATHSVFNPSCHTARQNIIYLGTWGPLQEFWLESLIPLGLSIYGSGWRHLRRSSPLRSCVVKNFGMGSGMKEAISGGRIVFNMVRAEHGCAHSMKSFEIPASGGFMLTNRTVEQEMFFEDGRSAAFYETMEEMLNKANFYLGNDAERERIRQNGLKDVYKHTYRRRARSLLSYMETGVMDT